MLQPVRLSTTERERYSNGNTPGLTDATTTPSLHNNEWAASRPKNMVDAADTEVLK